MVPSYLSSEISTFFRTSLVLQLLFSTCFTGLLLFSAAALRVNGREVGQGWTRAKPGDQPRPRGFN